MRAFRLLTLILAAAIGAAACKEEGTGVEVKELSFNGLKAVQASQLRSVLATTQSSKLPWNEKQYFDATAFKADLQRIIAFYVDRGFPRARIRTFDVKQSEDQRSVRITIDIEEGEPRIVERFAFEGFDVLPEDHRRLLESRLPLKPNQPLDRALAQANREMILDEFKDHGYPHPSVDMREQAGSAEDRRVLAYTARPGRIAYVGPVEISGAMSVSERIVRRQLTFRSGDLFEQNRLRESQRKLYALELFNFVNVEALAGAGDTAVQGSEADRIPTRVTVTEGKHRRVNFGVGYGSEEQARAQVDWRHVNFFGGARTAGVLARYSNLDRGVRLNFKQPYLFTRRHSATLSGQSWFTDEPAFRLTTIGGRATITREFGASRSAIFGARAGTTVALTYANEWEDYEIRRGDGERPDVPRRADRARAQPRLPDRATLRRRGRPALGAHPGRRARHHRQHPRRQVGLLRQPALRAGRPVPRRRLRLLRGHRRGALLPVARPAARRRRPRPGRIDRLERQRGRAGAVLQALLPRRRDQPARVGPLRGVAAQRRAATRSAATRSRTSRSKRVFPSSASSEACSSSTAATSGTEPWDFNLNDMRYDIGPGLRYQTPIGPIRLDVGYQLKEIPGLIVNGKKQTRPIRIHFSIGQAF